MNDKEFLNMAMEVAKTSDCHKRHYGAIIVSKDGKILSMGSNRTIGSECEINGFCKRMHLKTDADSYESCNSVHSEQNALIRANGDELKDATIYLVGEMPTEDGWVEIEDALPCSICNRMIQSSGIKKLVNRKRTIHY